MKSPHCLPEFQGTVEELLKALRPDEAYFWETHSGAEIDLVLFKHGRRIGVECKRQDAPTLTPSMRTALADLKLDRLLVDYPGARRYPLGDRVEVMPVAELIAAPRNPENVFEKRRR